MKSAAKTDRGLKRNQNQDTVFQSASGVGPLPNLFMVADGMGGHRGGGYCSSTLIERICSCLGQSGDKIPVRALRRAVEEANFSLYQESLRQESLSGMGSTLVAAFYEDDTLYVFNIGDSRLYVMDEEDPVPRQITRDHSYVEEMVKAGRMQRGSEVYNRNKNIITRAVGISPRIEMDMFEVPLREHSLVMLCTDGLTNMLSDEEIGCILREHLSPEEAVDQLVQAANHQGGADNISVVLFRPGEKEASL
jgi:protein phosphatase